MNASRRIASVVLLLGFPGTMLGQYWGERVLQKGFEQTEFFYRPSFLNPYGMTGFQSVTPGLISDPLLDLIINPARVDLDSSQSVYLYTDFRSAREVTESLPTIFPAYADYAARVSSDMIYFPRAYLATRRELEPVFSGALIGRVLPEAAPELLVGLSYQLVLQDDRYYGVPQDIYRTAAGYDYSGMRAAAADQIPIADRYSGKDNMHQEGNSLSGFARYALLENLVLGARLSRVTFERSGSHGSANLWQYSSASSSLWSNFEWRDQTYSHWDVSGGIEYTVLERSTIGLSGGYLWGEAAQSLRNADSSYYNYSSSPSGSYYIRSANTGQNWLQDGETKYFGIDFRSRLSPSTSLNLIYQYQHAAVDIGVGSSIQDTSYSTWTWENEGVVNSSTSHSLLNDVRNGGGTDLAMTHRFLASVQWRPSEKVTLSIGAQYEWYESETRTDESVLLASRSAYWSSQGDWDSRYSRNESKDLQWTFTTLRTSFQIPIFLTIQASEVVEFLIGLNRNMARWKLEDVTTAIFRYRESVNNGVVERRENFGERYTEPTEEVSDVQTAFLAGLTVSPTRALRLRLLMVPNFKDSYDGPELQQLQWWIGLALTP